MTGERIDIDEISRVCRSIVCVTKSAGGDSALHELVRRTNRSRR